MKRYRITVPKPYEKDGVAKNAWNRVGTLVEFEATADKPKGFILELNMFPSTRFAIFEDKPKEEQDNFDQSEPSAEEIIEYPEEEVNPDDIPF